MDIGPPELLILLVLLLVLFGGSQLPKLAKNLGKAQNEFRKSMAEGAESSGEAAPADKKAVASAGDTESGTPDSTKPSAAAADPAAADNDNTDSD